MVLRDKFFYSLKKFTFIFLSIFIAYSICAASVEPKIEVIEITFKDNALIDREEIFLKDISLTKCKESIKNKLGSIKIGRSPAPGKKKQLYARRIRSIINSKKWLLDYKLTIKAPDKIIVQRNFQNIPMDELKKMFVSYIYSKIGHENFKISDFKVRGLKDYPTGKINLNFSKHNRRQNIKMIAGRVRVGFDVDVGKKKCGNINITAWIDRFEKAVCTKEFIRKNSVLQRKDLIFKTINISKDPADYVKTFKQAVGKKVKRNIRSGLYLKSKDLITPFLIKKGDKIKLIARKGPIIIETFGIAKSNGVKGEQIRAENIRSGKTVIGTVYDEAIVNVLF